MSKSRDTRFTVFTIPRNDQRLSYNPGLENYFFSLRNAENSILVATISNIFQWSIPPDILDNHFTPHGMNITS